ncbi:MAG: FAD-dependent 5-carboxymethylaminomethyl-2-thiouridine(34) oxidoreductase MnmC [Alphaproteobacteria bacterium]
MTLIVGGGIAGCAAARALAERGHDVTLLEKHAVAAGASGNEAAVLYPPITKTWLARTEWYFTGYGFTLRQLARWREMGLGFAAGSPGMVKLPSDAQDAARLAGVNSVLGLDASIAEWLEAEPLSQRSGMRAGSGGVWFAEGTWLSPAELCRALVQHPRIALREGTEAASLARHGDGWRVTTAEGETFDAAQVVLCAAQEVKRFLPHLQLGMSAGQVTRVAADGAPGPIVCHKGYIVPRGDSCLLGATYDHADFSRAVTEANHARNLDAARAALPGWRIADAVTGGRTSLRATTPDRMPTIGEMEAGLYVSTGHGSRGMISAPLAAEMIASWISSGAPPVTQALAHSVSPLRQTASATVSENPSRAKMGA